MLKVYVYALMIGFVPVLYSMNADKKRDLINSLNEQRHSYYREIREFINRLDATCKDFDTNFDINTWEDYKSLPENARDCIFHIDLLRYGINATLEGVEDYDMTADARKSLNTLLYPYAEYYFAKKLSKQHKSVEARMRYQFMLSSGIQTNNKKIQATALNGMAHEFYLDGDKTTAAKFHEGASDLFNPQNTSEEKKTE